MNRGYFGIGIVHGKVDTNVGTLWRSAYQLGASFIFTVGRRHGRQCTDTVNAWKHIPLYEYDDFSVFERAAPKDCQWLGIEMGGQPLKHFKHPQRAIYFLGAEDHGLPKEVSDRMLLTIELPSVRTPSFNVAVAGSIVMAHRVMQ